jgi:hypothetical protein
MQIKDVGGKSNENSILEEEFSHLGFVSEGEDLDKNEWDKGFVETDRGKNREEKEKVPTDAYSIAEPILGDPVSGQESQLCIKMKEDAIPKMPKYINKVQLTRQSSRIQDGDTNIMSKTAKMKDTTDKGISLPMYNNSLPNTSSSNLDDITRVCGISLGENDAVRIANISFMEAKEAAAMALMKAKHKILSSSEDKKSEMVLEVDSNKESIEQNIEMNLEGNRAIEDHNANKVSK